MTAPSRDVPDKYELYRVILDYEALVDGFFDRIEDLNTTMALPSFADGQVQKLLTKNRGKRVQQARNNRHCDARRTFGWESLGKMLKDTGLALVLVVDDQRFAAVKDQLIERKRPRKPTIVSMEPPAWLFSKRNAANMRALGVQALSPQQRKRIAKKAARARWSKKGVAKRKRFIGASGSPVSTAGPADYPGLCLPEFPAPSGA